MDRTRPIQLVKTRGEQDLFKKEGSGSSALPSWVTAQDIQENAKNIGSTLGHLEKTLKLRLKNGNNLPILLVATLNDKATAKSYRPNVKSIFRTNRKSNVIGVAGVSQLYVKIDTLTDLQSIRNVVSDVMLNKAISKEKQIGMAAVKSLLEYHPSVEKKNLIGKTVKIRLIDYKSEKINRLATEHFLDECVHYGIQVTKLDYDEELLLYKVVNIEENQLDHVATMDSVISIKEMPYYEITASPEPWKIDIDIAKPLSHENYPQIGILDSGVASIRHLSQWQIGNEYNAAGLIENDIDRNHGTMVASIALYGDQLEQEEMTGCGPCMFANCIVNTRPDLAKVSEDELIMYIRESVRQFPNIKIWNISQGSTLEVSNDVFSEFAVALDNIQKTHHILFCKSAGNANNPCRRISQGAESVYSLTVGSVCQTARSEKDCHKGTLSPFSRIGPGPEYLHKPEIVHYGGNFVTGINVMTAPGYFSQVKGTSFATPRVSTLAAHLAHRIGGMFNPTLIKALIVHYAQYPSVVTKDSNDVLNSYGFGIPTTIDRMLYNDEDEFTMVWQPEIEPTSATDYQIIGFPYPSSLVDAEGNFYGIITVTVVSNPYLMGSEGNEYCQTDIEVSLGPIDHIEYVSPGAPGVSPFYRNATRAHMTKNVLTPSAYSKKQSSIYLNERNLIINQNKYQPVKKYRIDLSTLKPAIKAAMNGNSDWALIIKNLTRDAAMDELISNLQANGEIVKIPLAIVISIKDPNGNKIAYDECMRLLDQNNFEHTDIPIRQDIAIDADNLNNNL
jgi:hypothetical protein